VQSDAQRCKGSWKERSTERISRCRVGSRQDNPPRIQGQPVMRVSLELPNQDARGLLGGSSPGASANQGRDWCTIFVPLSLGSRTSAVQDLSAYQALAYQNNSIRHGSCSVGSLPCPARFAIVASRSVVSEFVNN